MNAPSGVVVTPSLNCADYAGHSWGVMYLKNVKRCLICRRCGCLSYAVGVFAGNIRARWVAKNLMPKP